MEIKMEIPKLTQAQKIDYLFKNKWEEEKSREEHKRYVQSLPWYIRHLPQVFVFGFFILIMLSVCLSYLKII